MAGETDNPEDAAARLEAALERIARLAGTSPAASLPGGTLPGGTLAGGTLPGGTLAGEALPDGTLPDGTAEPAGPVEEIAARLDGLIDRLRAALSGSSGGKPG